MVSRRKKIDNLVPSMAWLAGVLNKLSVLKDETNNRDWDCLETIVSQVLFGPDRKEKAMCVDTAATFFNNLAKKHPVPLQIGRLPEESRPLLPEDDRWLVDKDWAKRNSSVQDKIWTRSTAQTRFNAKNTFNSALLAIYKDYFPPGDGWQRLKRCPQCNKWFYDRTRNKKRDRCSRHCTWLWWSRERRKEEGHPSQRPTRYQSKPSKTRKED